jgi:hypothetical protein
MKANQGKSNIAERKKSVKTNSRWFFRKNRLSIAMLHLEFKMKADEEGFEPPGLIVRGISSAVPSTTRPPIRIEKTAFFIHLF